MQGFPHVCTMKVLEVEGNCYYCNINSNTMAKGKNAVKETKKKPEKTKKEKKAEKIAKKGSKS